MIVNFSIQNFASVKDKQTLSFEAEKSNHLEDYYVIKTNGKRLLKMILIYGANASGKTNVLKALDFLRKLVLNPLREKTEELEFQPFLFDEKIQNNNSILSIEFIANNIRYFYEVEFNKKAIIREVLYFFNPNKALVFERTTDVKKQLSEITFGNKIKIDKSGQQNLQANTLWNNTVFGGFLKTNVNIKELKEVVDWFNNYLYPLIYTETKLIDFVSHKIEKKEIPKKNIITVLQKSDLNITDIKFQEKELKDEKVISELNEDLKKKFGEKVERIIVRKKVLTTKILFEHYIKGKKYFLPIELESDGTKRFYGFAGLLSMLIKNPCAFPIDELEASLHPDLFQFFILSFLVNAKNSQIIATTHNREILSDRNIFRDDVIWFTDKNKHGATELYSLADFHSSVVRDTTNVLNIYKSGKLGAVPNLSDYYFDLDK